MMWNSDQGQIWLITKIDVILGKNKIKFCQILFFINFMYIHAMQKFRGVCVHSPGRTGYVPLSSAEFPATCP